MKHQSTHKTDQNGQNKASGEALDMEVYHADVGILTEVKTKDGATWQSLDLHEIGNSSRHYQSTL